MTLHRLQRPDWLLAAALWLVTAAVYAQTISFDFVNYDDNQYVFDNPQTQAGLTLETVRHSFTQVTAGNWHPVTMLSHALDTELFGVRPGGPHAVNALLHSVNAALLFVALVWMTGARWPAALTAGVFALHPQRVESVAWISERKDVLSGLFFMLTLLGYVRYAAAPTVGRYMCVAGALVLGLLSKPMLVTVPFWLLLLDVWPLRRFESPVGPTMHRLIVEKLPLLALSVGASAVAIAAQRSDRSVASITVLPVMDRLSNAPVAVLQYLRQFVWPSDLAPLYWHPWIAPSTGLSAATVVACAAAVVVLSIAAVAMFHRAPWITVGWLWLIGMLVPVIGIVQVGWQGRADRYTYLPMIGVAMALWFSLSELLRREHRARVPVSVLSGALLLALGVATVRQAQHWRSSVSLWTRALASQPANSIALNNLGSAFAAAGDNAGAMDAFERAIALNPRAAEAMHNLANQHLARGNDPAAKRLLRDALTANPHLIEAYSSLAGIYLREGRPEAALMLYEQATQRDPTYADGFYNQAITLGQAGRFAEAIAALERVLQLRPDDAEAARALAFARKQSKADETNGNSPATRPNE